MQRAYFAGVDANESELGAIRLFVGRPLKKKSSSRGMLVTLSLKYSHNEYYDQTELQHPSCEMTEEDFKENT